MTGAFIMDSQLVAISPVAAGRSHGNMPHPNPSPEGEGLEPGGTQAWSAIHSEGPAG